MGLESVFLENIATKIEILAKEYRYVVKEIEIDRECKISASTKEGVEYSLLIEHLNRAIDNFKRDMKKSLKDFYSILRVRVEISDAMAKSFLKNKLEILHKEYERFISVQIPEEIVKEKLGHNYFFHQNVKKLTPEILLDYFETNYMLLMEEDIKSF